MNLTISSDAMAATDPRVLGVARALFSGTELPASQQDFSFDFIGLVGLAGPLRQNVLSQPLCVNAKLQALGWS